MTHVERVVAAAMLWVDTPYRHRASTLGAGCDCLGLIRGVWRELYGAEPEKLPHYAIDPRRDADQSLLQKAAETHLIECDGPPQTGDVLLFQLRQGHPPRHCGILVAPNLFVHAQERIGVVIAPMTSGWETRIFSSFSFPSGNI